MGTGKRIIKNTAITFIGNNVLKIVSLVLIIIIARFLGDVQYGLFTFAISFTGLFYVVMDLGTRILVVRDIAKKKSQAPVIIGNTLALKVATSIGVFAVILALSFVLGYDQTTIIAVGIASVGLVFDSLSTTLSSGFQAFERLEFPTGAKVLRVLVRAALTIPLLLAGYGLFYVLMAYALVHILAFILSLILFVRYISPITFQYSKPIITRLVKNSFPFLLSGIFVSLYFSIDVTMMSKLAPASFLGIDQARHAAIGWYGAVYNLLDAIISIPLAVSAATLPVFITLLKTSKKKLHFVYHTILRYLALLSVPIAVGMTLLAPGIIELLYGSEFSNGALALQIMIWTIIPLFFNYIFGAMMITLHKEKEGVIILFMNVVINVTLNIILIPRYSLYGAALSTVLTELFYMSGYYYIVKKQMGSVPFATLLAKPVLAASIMALAIFAIPSVHVLLLIVIGTVAYTISLVLLRAIQRDDITLLKAALQRK